MKLSQIAYARFKESLFASRIIPGAVMSQQELSAIVGVPVGPLREAVQILESEGLLTVMPRNGIRICKPDMALIRHAFQLRRILERDAAWRWAEQGDNGLMATQEQAHLDIMARVEAQPEAADLWDAAREVDIGFHDTLIAGLRNPLISGVFDRVYCQIRLVRLDQQYVLSASLIRRTIAEHLGIIAALRRRDSEAAAAAMDDHLIQAMHRTMWL